MLPTSFQLDITKQKALVDAGLESVFREITAQVDVISKNMADSLRLMKITFGGGMGVIMTTTFLDMPLCRHKGSDVIFWKFEQGCHKCALLGLLCVAVV